MTKISSIKLDYKNKMDGIELLKGLHDAYTPLVFFDPEYRGVMDKMKYGNEGARQKERSLLPQMSEEVITRFIEQIDRVLKPSGHLMLWVDKFHLCEGIQNWIENTDLEIVDLVTWDKGKIGMGYRTRRRSEYLLILQKKPKRAKGIWTRHDIPDVWIEKLNGDRHPHAKPKGLLTALILATSKEGDTIIDPAAGGFSIMELALKHNRHFMGGDLNVD
jgi:site-specific DNA-methyltransferase (adenine-specific)